MKHATFVLAMGLLLGLAGCAGGPRYDTRQVNTALTPAQVVAAPDAHVGAQVIWGGLIVTTRNQPGYTEMEILSYPLDSAQRPDIRLSAQGRFIARYSGYLEGVDYAPGRQITLKGQVVKILAGKVGEAPYNFPLIQADNVYLWPIESRTYSSQPQFHFGVGVIFH